MTRHWIRAPKGLAAIAAATVLSGCALATSGQPYESLHPITVGLEPELLELAPKDSLGDTQRLQVAAFARRYSRDGQGDLTVAYPVDEPARPFVDDVLAELSAQGVGASRLETGPYSTDAEGDRGVVIFYMTTSASGAPCDDLWGETMINPHNDKSRRLGCAYRTNLAAMLTEPRDLITPRAETPADLQRRRSVLELYRSGEETAAEGSDETVDTTE